MDKKKKLSGSLKSRINLMGYKSISKEFDVPVLTLQSITKKFKSYHTEEDLVGRGGKQTYWPYSLEIQS